MSVPEQSVVKGASTSFWVLVTLLLSALLLGGGSRDDIISLLILRPVTAAIFVYAVAYFGGPFWQAERGLGIWLLAVFALLLLHLLPLPPAVWSALPGREPIVAAFAAAAMDRPWLPLSIDPPTTWNALFALLAPSAALMLALSQPVDRLTSVARIILCFIFAGGLVGLLQVIGSSGGGLYFYRITNATDAVGFFANRNHHAVAMACAFPLLAMHLSLLRRSADVVKLNKRLVLAAGCLLVPLILVAGSRAGLITGVAGLVLAIWIYRDPVAIGRSVRRPSSTIRQATIVGAGVAALVVVTLLASRAVAINRLLMSDSVAEGRVETAPVIWQATSAFFPFGRGIGTFVRGYAMFEPDNLLGPRYLNHAHNDLFELIMTGGVPAVLLALAILALLVRPAIALVVRPAFTKSNTPFIIVGRTGMAILALLIMASIGDYPLRTPSLAVVAAISLAFVFIGWRGLDKASIAIDGR